MKTFLSIALCLLLAGSAEAAKKPKKPAADGAKPEFKKLDKNGDGIITPREYGEGTKDPKAGKAFGKLDKDKSGSLTPSELSGGKKDAAKKKKK